MLASIQTTVQTRSQMSHQQQLQSQHHRQQRPRPIIIAAYHRQPIIPTSQTQPTPPPTTTITASPILTLIYHTNTTINIIQIQILTQSVARIIMQTTITGRINSITIVVIV